MSKIRKNLRKGLTFIICNVSFGAVLLLTSCLDTSVLPNDVTIGEDYWKDKADVQGMVAGTYKSVCTEGVMERFIVWGGFRSDDLNALNSVLNVTKENNLKDIAAGNMNYNNTYADWMSIYQVINRCNIVLEKARSVVEIDPSYTLETYYTDESQMLALRALCYFYLVRTFRDVPYTTHAYMNSSQGFGAPQMAPSYVLQRCIEDLEAALAHPLSSAGFADWRKVGLITRDAIKSILADVYLWRGSMMHNQADYEQAIKYCDEVIESKRTQDANSQKDEGGRRPGQSAVQNESEYPLIAGENAYAQIFTVGNSKESILEFQMDGSNDTNDGLRNCYWSYDASNRKQGLMMAPGIFGRAGNEANLVYKTEYDYRFWENCFDVNSTSEKSEFEVRKMVSLSTLNNSADSRSAERTSHPGSSIGRPEGASRFAQNWIAYRLTDVMLMKAEALVQRGDSASFLQAFSLVHEVSKRAMADTAYAVTNTCTTQADYERLVLDERQRELCFEGKRWFDLVRYNYRHVDGIQPDKTLYEIADGESKNVNNFVKNYTEMMTLMERKYSEGGAAIGSKMSTEAHLYFPILNSEMKVNVNLRQNPVYEEDDIYVKNN